MQIEIKNSASFSQHPTGMPIAVERVEWFRRILYYLYIIIVRITDWRNTLFRRILQIIDLQNAILGDIL